MFSFGKATLVLNEAALKAELKSASTNGRRERAEEVAEMARNDAPVVSGAYRDGIGVDVSGDDVFLVDDDPDAIFKEYGTVDTPPHSVLTNAGKAFSE